MCNAHGIVREEDKITVREVKSLKEEQLSFFRETVISSALT